jgi:hypothetical protein
MEIFRHVYQIGSSIADRNLFQYLFVGDNTVLLDTGASNTPNETIFPFLKQIVTHWPTFHGSQVSEFLGESRRFVDSASNLIWRSLEKHPHGVTLQACMDECGPALGAWPATNQWLLMYPLHGHLLHLEQQGRVTKVRGQGHVQWKITN